MASYTVAPGDTMWQIANANSVSLDDLIAANPQVQNPSMIEVGQVLNLPGSGGAAAVAAHPPPPAPVADHAPAQFYCPAPSNPPASVSQYTPPPPPPPGEPTFKTVAYFTNWVWPFDLVELLCKANCWK